MRYNTLFYRNFREDWILSNFVVIGAGLLGNELKKIIVDMGHDVKIIQNIIVYLVSNENYVNVWNCLVFSLFSFFECVC